MMHHRDDAIPITIHRATNHLDATLSLSPMGSISQKMIVAIQTQRIEVDGTSFYLGRRLRFLSQVPMPPHRY